jgi:hypothetical protein
MESGLAELLGSEFTLFGAALVGLAVTCLAIVRDLGASRSHTLVLSAGIVLVPVAPVVEGVRVL